MLKAMLTRLWRAPMRALGAFVCWSSSSRVTRRTGDVTYARAGGYVRAFLQRGRFAAISIGETMFFLGQVPEPDLSIVRHELSHVAQARYWGPLYPLMYGAGWLLGLHRALVLGVTTWHGIYQLNPFEVAARRAERTESARTPTPPPAA